eukprot:701863-Hanusia_phi.AAC.1
MRTPWGGDQERRGKGREGKGREGKGRDRMGWDERKKRGNHLFPFRFFFHLFYPSSRVCYLLLHLLYLLLELLILTFLLLDVSVGRQEGVILLGEEGGEGGEGREGGGTVVAPWQAYHVALLRERRNRHGSGGCKGRGAMEWGVQFYIRARKGKML